jgi:hypothetical protein
MSTREPPERRVEEDAQRGPGREDPDDGRTSEP